MGINNLCFYCHFGAGDLLESREFVKEWMRKVDAKNYFYAHGKNPKVLRDISNLQFTEVTEEMSPILPTVSIGNDLYVNTWIGRDGRYVLPGIGCVVEMHYKMHNDVFRSLRLSPLEKPIIDYIPKINYLEFDIEDCIRFLEKYKNDRMVLFSNGPVQSNQAENFDFTPILKEVALKYKDILFLVSANTDLKLDNIFYTSDITNVKDGFDLNEISFLSLYCDTIIGRNSGPHVFAQVYDNWMDSNKAILSFTYKEIAATFVLSQPVLMKKYWSDRTDFDGVFEKICEVLERKD